MFAAINTVIGVLVGIIAAIIMRGWVLSIMWSWFIVPLGAIALTIPMSLGVVMVVSLFTSHLANDTESTISYNGHNGKEVVIAASLKAFGAPLVTLFFAWTITLFM